MELLDRYLQAVKKHLPFQRQDDIIAELRANLESQLEDKEAELGRPLTKDEMEAWLKQIGPPMQVAARYLPQRYLIGPAVFPMYWYVLKLACLWCLIIYTFVNVLEIFTNNPTSVAAVIEALIKVLLRAPWSLIPAAAIVTLVFAVIEFGITRNPPLCGPLAGAVSGWSPATLPPMDKTAVAGKKPRSFAQAVAEVIFEFLFLAWLLLIPGHPWLLMGPGAVYIQHSPYQLAPVWIQFYWCIVGLNILQIVWNCIDLGLGGWQRPWPAKQIAMKVFGLIPVLVLLAAPGHLYASLKNPALDHTLHGAQLDSINHGVYRAFLIVCAIVVLQLLWEMGRMGVDSYRKRAAAAQ
jgi:hypothetical protein